MFLRFTKGKFEKGGIRLYRKCVFLGGSLVMEYADKIVGVARLHEETEKCYDYDVIVAGRCELGAETIARYIKDMIGKSNKFKIEPSPKRRKYYVEKIDCAELPIIANITFKRL